MLQNHLVQFIHSSGGLQARRYFLQLIWLCCIWVMWNKGNNRVFKAKENIIHPMLDKVKLHSFWWLKAYNVNLGLNSYMWWSSPFACMNIR